MVESKFCTPVTYKLSSLTKDEWLVTPYQVRVDVRSRGASLYRLYVDGLLVNWKVCSGEKGFVFRGVCGDSGTRELLFSIPTRECSIVCASCSESSSATDVGTIAVVEYEAIYSGCRYQHWKGVSLSNTRVDATNHPRPSSKEGKLMVSIKPYDKFHVWDVGRELGRRCVEYHTAHGLRDIGMSIVDTNWGKVSHNIVKNY